MNEEEILESVIKTFLDVIKSLQFDALNRDNVIQELNTRIRLLVNEVENLKRTRGV